MHPTAYKAGFYAMFSWVALALACVCAQAQVQDSAVNSGPVDRSVHAGVDESSDRTSDPPDSQAVSKNPQLLSQWSPRIVKPLPATTTWSGKVNVVNAAGMNEDASSSVSPIKNIPKSFGARSVLGDSRTTAPGGTGPNSNFNAGIHFNASLLAETNSKSSASLAILPAVPDPTPFSATGTAKPFDAYPFGRQFGTPFSSKKTYSDQAVRKQPGAESRITLPNLHPSSSPDSQSNLKP